METALMAGKSWHPTTQKGEEMGTCHTDNTLEIKHLAEGGKGEGKQLLQRVLALKKLLMLKEMLTKHRVLQRPLVQENVKYWCMHTAKHWLQRLDLCSLLFILLMIRSIFVFILISIQEWGNHVRQYKIVYIQWRVKLVDLAENHIVRYLIFQKKAISVINIFVFLFIFQSFFSTLF